MTTTAAAADSGSRSEEGGGGRSWLIVVVFLIFYIFSHIDRQIISMMVGPIEKAFDLTDLQLSLLMGPAFALFYVICGLPMGWLVDRVSRKWLAIGGVVVWGLATVYCGLAKSYAQLFIGRLGVGVGESTLTPAAHASIAENFPQHRLATALSVYTTGATLGAGLAMMTGGWVVHLASTGGEVTLPLLGVVEPWQMVFLGVGLATVLCAPLGLIIRDRDRTPGAKGHGRFTPRPTPITSETLIELLRDHWRLYLIAPLGFGFTTIIIGAYGSWLPTFMIRTYGWNPAQAGTALGVQHIIAGVIGYQVGAFIVDRMFQRGVKDAHLRYHMLSLLLTIPTAVLALYGGNPWLFVILTGFFYMFTNPYIGIAGAALQLYTPANLRGQVAATFLAVVTILGSGMGAVITALLTEHVFQDKAKIGLSLICVTLGCVPFTVGCLLVAARKMRALAVQQAAMTTS